MNSINITYIYIPIAIHIILIYIETDVLLNKLFTWYSVASSTYSNTYLSIAMKVTNRSHALDLTVNLWKFEAGTRMDFEVINRICQSEEFAYEWNN